MTLNIYIYTLSYFFIVFSTIGYGFFISNIIYKNNKDINFGYFGLFGILFLITYSYSTNIFYAHSKIHNFLFLLIGFIFFLNFFIKNYKLLKKNLFLTIIVFSVLFLGSLLSKTHDDFSYYHFAYTYYLTQSDSMIGIGQFNHGFRTHSSIFYISSLFYLPKIDLYLFHLTPIMVMGFANIILLKKIVNNFELKKINFINYYSIFALIFINVFFYRIAEHGTDRSAQILIFILILEILIFLNNKNIVRNNIYFIYALLAIIISFKAFYILYSILILPIIFLVFKQLKIKKAFNFFFYNLSFMISFLIILLVGFTNFLNTGCILYPIQNTCFFNLDWSIPKQQVISMNNFYGLWAKAGAAPNFRVENIEEYIKGFNWVSNWINKYFFTKVSDFLLGVTFVSSLIFFVFYSKSKKEIQKGNFHFIYMLLIILFLEWFYFHPALRYGGGYVVIALIFFLPLSFYLEKFQYILKKSIKKFYILIAISLLIFVFRNVDRIINEIDQYQYKPLNYVFKLERKYYKVYDNISKTKNNYINCNLNQNNCDNSLKPNVKKIFGKYLFINN